MDRLTIPLLLLTEAFLFFSLTTYTGGRWLGLAIIFGLTALALCFVRLRRRELAS